MAHGSMRQMRRYVDKVFAKEERLGRMSDGRRDPTLPLPAVLATWQWGLMRRTPSTEQIGDLLRDRHWRARLGLKPEAGGSADRAAEVLENLAMEEWNEMMLQDFFLARRAGVLSDEGLYGKRCAVLDLNELLNSEKIHGPQCQVREKTVQEEQGEKRIVQEYYHPAVALVWVSGPIPFVLGGELLAPGGGRVDGGATASRTPSAALAQESGSDLGPRAVLLPALFQNRLRSRPGGLGHQLRGNREG
jgi:hypothetical protein